MNVRIEKIKKHFRDNKEIYIGSAIGAVVGVVAGMVIAAKINAAKDGPSIFATPASVADTIAEGESLMREVQELVDYEVAAAREQEARAAMRIVDAA
jgi:hypothetical protein